MSLKVELKPGERLIVGNCVITNSDQRTRLFIDGKAPILREKDILTFETADSPAKRIYFAVQLMYIHEDVAKQIEEHLAMAPGELDLPFRRGGVDWALIGQALRIVVDTAQRLQVPRRLRVVRFFLPVPERRLPCWSEQPIGLPRVSYVIASSFPVLLAVFL